MKIYAFSRIDFDFVREEPMSAAEYIVPERCYESENDVMVAVAKAIEDHRDRLGLYLTADIIQDALVRGRDEVTPKMVSNFAWHTDNADLKTFYWEESDDYFYVYSMELGGD